MAEKEPDQPSSDGPSLELPSFGFGRKRRRKSDPGAAQRSRAEADARQTPAPTPKAPEPVREERPEPAPPQRPAPAPGDQLVEEPVATAAESGGRTAGPWRRLPELPDIAPRPAALVTGVLVGVLTVGATWASMRLCELVRGTPSCGDPGFIVLLAVAVAMVLVGRLVLSTLGVPEAGSTSFLGVGLLAMLVLVFLADLLFNWWMVLVVPPVAAGSFALAHWVTSTYVGPEVGSSAHR